MSDIPYPHRVEVLRRTPGVGTDDRGRPLVSVPTLATTVDGWVQPRGTREVAALHQAGLTVTQYVLFTDALVQRGDRLRRVDTGEEFEVLGEPDDAAGVGDHYEVGIERVRA